MTHRLAHPSRLASTLAALALAGCWLDGGDTPGAGNLPQRSSEEVHAYVAELQRTAHAADAPVAQGLAGVWSGQVRIGTMAADVHGVTSGTGFIALADQRSTHVYVLSDLRHAGGRFVATLTHRSGTTSERYVVTGPQRAGALEGLVLPTGWTLDDVSGGRVATPTEQARFGRLLLSRTDPAAEADRRATVPAFATGAAMEGGTATIQTDARGNLLIEMPGCMLRGGIAASTSVAGVLEWAGTTEGIGCAMPGMPSGSLTGAAWQSQPGLYTVIGVNGSSAVSAVASLP